MSKIEISGFTGETPRIGPMLLKQSNSQFAETCDLVSGEIKTWKGLSDVLTLAKSGEIKKIHHFDETNWLQWNEEVDATKVALAGDVTERTVFTGLDAPRIVDTSLVDIGGNEEYPESSLLLGIPVPTTKPTVTLNGTGSGNIEATFYVYTYVRTWDSGTTDEGPPSPASISLDVETDHTVDITDFVDPPAGDYAITHKRIYRSVTAGGETTLHYVDEIPISQADYNDSVLTADLGEVLISTFFDPPPDDMIAIISLENGILAGISKNEICFCEPYQFHAWPVLYRIALEDNGIALGNIGGTLVVGTSDHPYLISGVDPATMSEIQLPGRYPCISKRGMISSSAGVFYPSSEGLVMVSPASGAKIVTKGLLAKEDWLALHPGSIHAYYHSNRYFGFFSHEGVEGGFIINFDAGDLTRLPYYATSGYVCGEEATLFLVFAENGSNILKEWNKGGAPLFYTWKSKTFVTPPLNFSVAEVLSDISAAYDQDAVDTIIAYNQAIIDASLYGCGDIAGADIGSHDIAGDCLTYVPSENLTDTLWFKVFGDGELFYSKLVEDDEPFRLPGGTMFKEWIFQVSGNKNVQRITIATNMRELTHRG